MQLFRHEIVRKKFDFVNSSLELTEDLPVLRVLRSQIDSPDEIGRVCTCRIANKEALRNGKGRKYL